jgi:3-oxoacyl-[acyl-carrier protein] reductase
MRGKTVVVTGAFGALGRGMLRAALDAGARVAAIDQAAPVEAAALVGPDGIVEGGVDLADPAAAGPAMGRIAGAFGRIDGLVNIAGAFRWEMLADGKAETWALMHRVNVMTAAGASRAVLQHMQEGGAIVNIGAGAAIKSGAGMGAYAASKAGVHRLTESLADELKGRVRVNAILPSTIDTPANRKDMPDADFSKWVTPQEIAEVILFLLSDKASGVTGALVPVSGRV